MAAALAAAATAASLLQLLCVGPSTLPGQLEQLRVREYMLVSPQSKRTKPRALEALRHCMYCMRRMRAKIRPVAARCVARPPPRAPG